MSLSAVINPSSALRANRRFYRENANEFCQNTGSLDVSHLYEPFLAQLPPGARLLDAGCGSGRDSAVFQQLGFEVVAIDASPEMVAAARSRGVRAQKMLLQDIEFDGEFDGIWACASLLHVPRVEMPAVLVRHARALRPGGLMYISIKEGEGERVGADGRFFSYFGLKEFTDLLRDARHLDVVRSWRTDDVMSNQTRSWLNFLVRRRNLPPAQGAK
jgi:SAM-dependent methyltransferase